MPPCFTQWDTKYKKLFGVFRERRLEEEGGRPAVKPKQGPSGEGLSAECRKYSDQEQSEGQGKGLRMICNGTRAGEKAGSGV